MIFSNSSIRKSVFNGTRGWAWSMWRRITLITEFNEPTQLNKIICVCLQQEDDGAAGAGRSQQDADGGAEGSSQHSSEWGENNVWDTSKLRVWKAKSADCVSGKVRWMLCCAQTVYKGWLQFWPLSEATLHGHDVRDLSVTRCSRLLRHSCLPCRGLYSRLTSGYVIVSATKSSVIRWSTCH